MKTSAVRITLLILLMSFVGAAQTFEVASVKPAAPYKDGPIHIGTDGGPGTDNPTRLTFSNATLAMILQTAFELQDVQKINGPEWMNVDMFDIAAKLPPDATREQMRAMLRNLLAERFHLAVHRETQSLPAWVLIAAKGRAKLRATKNPASTPSRKENERPGIRSIICENCTAGEFVKMLGHPEGRLVFDETGLTGTYDFALTYEPDYGACKGCTMGGLGASAPPPPPAANEAPPVLSVAIEQQLGLKLERRQMPVDVMVIDRIDRVPVEN